MRYTADLPFAGLAHARLVLSAHASPLVRKSGPGTRAPPAGRGYGTCRGDLGWTDSPCGPDLRLLARDRVYYAGQPGAVVVDETPGATEAAALVEVELDQLPASDRSRAGDAER